MARILTVSERTAQADQLQIIERVKAMYGGMLPGIVQVLLAEPRLAEPALEIYRHLQLGRSSALTRLQREMVATLVNGIVGGTACLGIHADAVRRLSRDEGLGGEFTAAWPQGDREPRTRALLKYARKLSEAPGQVDDADVEALRAAGWDERGIYEATVLIAFHNFTGRLDAAAGLPMDRVPPSAPLAEAMPD